MKEAGINEATLGVFSWAMYEPGEGVFNFDWLVQIMDNLYKKRNPYDTCHAFRSPACMVGQ